MKTISADHFVELIKKSYSLDHIFLLEQIKQDLDISSLRKDSVKIETLYTGLVRKGLVTDDGKLTIGGNELLDFMNTKSGTKLAKKKTEVTGFDDWWKAYPGTDTFTHKGQAFHGSRVLRAGKDDCRLKFGKILQEGEYTAAELIEALKYDVLQKKEISVTRKENKLSYMQNSLTYLNQRSFESIIELIKEGATIKEAYVPKRGIDV